MMTNDNSLETSPPIQIPHKNEAPLDPSSPLLQSLQKSSKSLRNSVNFRKSFRKSIGNTHRKSKGKSTKNIVPITEIKTTIPVFNLNIQKNLDISNELKKNPLLKIKTDHEKFFHEILKKLCIEKTDEKQSLELSCKDIPRNTILKEETKKTCGFRYFIDNEEKFATKESKEKVSNQSKDNIITEENIKALYAYFEALGFPQKIIPFLSTHLCQTKFLAIPNDIFYYLKQIKHENTYISLHAHQHLTSILWDSKKAELTLSIKNPVQDSDSGYDDADELPGKELDFLSEIKIHFPENSDEKPKVTEVNATFSFKDLGSCYHLFPTIFQSHIEKLQAIPSHDEQYSKAQAELSVIKDSLLIYIKSTAGILQSLAFSYKRQSCGHLTTQKMDKDQQDILYIKQSIENFLSIYELQKEPILEWLNKKYDKKPFLTWLDNTLLTNCKSNPSFELTDAHIKHFRNYCATQLKDIETAQLARIKEKKAPIKNKPPEQTKNTILPELKPPTRKTFTDYLKDSFNTLLSPRRMLPQDSETLPTTPRTPSTPRMGEKK